MKKVFIFLLFLFICMRSMAFDLNPKIGNHFNPQKPFTINLNDTVVFDLAQADTSFSHVKFPVYILSDDTVNALDFSFKYNETNFIYDSISDLTNYLQTFSYYNPFDSTLRFTSNSFQRYQNDSALLLIRFTVLSGQFCIPDLRAVKAYLNGDACSIKIVDCLHLNVAELEKKMDALEVYPNPAIDLVHIKFNHDATIELFALDGRRIWASNIKNGQDFEIPTSSLNNGVYMIHLYYENKSITKKISIQRN